MTPTLPTVRASARSGSRGSVRWARLLARIYHAHPLVCPACGERMRLIAFLTDPFSIREVLDPLEVPTRPPRVRPPRGPPEPTPELALEPILPA